MVPKIANKRCHTQYQIDMNKCIIFLWGEISLFYNDALLKCVHSEQEKAYSCE
jgi:hypothetical protein